MPWTTVDDKSRFQPPPIQHWDVPPPRPIFPLYNVVMNALSTILPALDPVNIAERKARIMDLQMQSSPQARALRQLQLDSAKKNLEYQNWLQGATMDYYRKHPEIAPGKTVPTNLIPPAPAVPPQVHAITQAHPGGLPVLNEDGTPASQTSLENKQPIEVAPAAPNVESGLPGKGISPEEGEKKFGPLPGFEGPPPEGQSPLPNPPPGEQGQPPVPVTSTAAPVSLAQAWGTTGQDLGLPDRRWQSEEQQATAPEVMV